jgi:hypothetical protein
MKIKNAYVLKDTDEITFTGKQLREFKKKVIKEYERKSIKELEK